MTSHPTPTNQPARRPPHRGAPRAAHHPTRALIAILTATLALLLTHTTRAQVQTQSQTQTQSHTQTLNTTTHTITLNLSPTNPTVADTITLTITARPNNTPSPTAPDWTATRANLEAALPDAITLDPTPRARPSAIPSASQPFNITFNLQPLTPGQFTIAPFTIPTTTTSTDQNSSNDPANAPTTEPISISITSTFAEGEQPALAELRSIAEPRWPFPWLTTTLIATAAALTITAACLAIATIQRRRNTRIITITAHENAHNELNRVLAHKDLEAGRFALLLQRLSAILRGYLEDRFHLRAPNLTTPEFLREAESAALNPTALTPEDRRALAEFLSRIDLVKYAGAHATRDDAQRAIDAVRGFIDRTADPTATLIIQRGRTRFPRPGAAARLLPDPTPQP
ncbi:MAG: hypothetical protein ACTS3F_11160 [Phycisphaerales bacterium]